MQAHNDNKTLSVFFVISLALHIFLVLVINAEAFEAMFAGVGNSTGQMIVRVRLEGPDKPANKGGEKTTEVSQPEKKATGNVENKETQPTNKVVVEPVEKAQTNPPTTQTTATKPPQTTQQTTTPAPQKVEPPTPKPDPETVQLPKQEVPPAIEVVTSQTSTFEVDLSDMTQEAKGEAAPEVEETIQGDAIEKTGSPDGNSDKYVPPKGDDYITRAGGTGGWTTKNIESLEYTGELEMIFEVDREGKLTVVLVRGMGEERFNRELVSLAERSWKGRFDAEARALFPNGYKVPVIVVFEKGVGTHKFGEVQPLE